jgi:hypothetical protein
MITPADLIASVAIAYALGYATHALVAWSRSRLP